MREFVRGWRRKVGGVLLLAAVAFAGMWIRSNVRIDAVHFAIGARDHSIYSLLGGVTWQSYDLVPWPSSAAPIPWAQFKEAGSKKIEDVTGPETNSLTDFADGDTGLPDQRHWTAYYWWVVSPLTLLSAFLILWPVKRATKPTTSTCGEHDPQ